MVICEEQLRKAGERLCFNRFQGPREVQSILCHYYFVNLIHHPEGELSDGKKDTMLSLNFK